VGAGFYDCSIGVKYFGEPAPTRDGKIGIVRDRKIGILKAIEEEESES
jgi:hypothetical protein